LISADPQSSVDESERVAMIGRPGSMVSILLSKYYTFLGAHWAQKHLKKPLEAIYDAGSTVRLAFSSCHLIVF